MQLKICKRVHMGVFKTPSFLYMLEPMSKNMFPKFLTFLEKRVKSYAILLFARASDLCETMENWKIHNFFVFNQIGWNFYHSFPWRKGINSTLKIHTRWYKKVQILFSRFFIFFSPWACHAHKKMCYHQNFNKIQNQVPYSNIIPYMK